MNGMVASQIKDIPMTSSLIPEKPILVYPSLAAQIGLEEATLLTTLSNLTDNTEGAANNGYKWYVINVSQLLIKLPFWDARDIQRVITNLREKAIVIIASPPIPQTEQLKFAFNERAVARQQPPHYQNQRNQHANGASHRDLRGAGTETHAPSGNFGAPNRANNNAADTTPTQSPPTQPPNYLNRHNATEPLFMSKNYIAPNWRPDDDTLSQLAQHNINKEFAFQQLPEFITYWRERGEPHHSWGSKFLTHVIRKWRDYEARQHQKNQEYAIDRNWKPSLDALEIMTQQAEIPINFIEDAIPEFILYWQERGDRLNTWNSKFSQHVRLQWKKFNSAIESSTDPKPIPGNWQPSEDVYDVLRLANIDLNFAQSLIPEFVIYWRDSNQVHTSWNTRYLQHVKRRWAGRHALSANTNPLAPENNNRSTRDISLEEELTDRSWAN